MNCRLKLSQLIYFYVFERSRFLVRWVELDKIIKMIISLVFIDYKFRSKIAHKCFLDIYDNAIISPLIIHSNEWIYFWCIHCIVMSYCSFPFTNWIRYNNILKLLNGLMRCFNIIYCIIHYFFTLFGQEILCGHISYIQHAILLYFNHILHFCFTFLMWK